MRYALRPAAVSPSSKNAEKGCVLQRHDSSLKQHTLRRPHAAASGGERAPGGDAGKETAQVTAGRSLQDSLTSLERYASAAKAAAAAPEAGERRGARAGARSAARTIAEQLAESSAESSGEEDEDLVVPLGRRRRPASASELTLAQRRNIRRQALLDKVSQRNDAPFFAGLALLVLLPPLCILGVAVASGLIEVPFS